MQSVVQVTITVEHLTGEDPTQWDWQSLVDEMGTVERVEAK